MAGALRARYDASSLPQGQAMRRRDFIKVIGSGAVVVARGAGAAILNRRVHSVGPEASKNWISLAC